MCPTVILQGVPRSGLDEGGQVGENSVHHEDQPALQRRKSRQTLQVTSCLSVRSASVMIDYQVQSASFTPDKKPFNTR